MNCTQCGAGLQISADQQNLECRFCAAEYVLPRETITEDGVIVLERQTGSRCPNCQEFLKLALVDQSPAESCPACGGLLLEDVVFVQLVQSRRGAYRGADQPQTPIDPATLRREHHCPSCDTIMDRHLYSGPGNVVIDSCFACQLIWLDAGELTDIEQAPGRRAAF